MPATFEFSSITRRRLPHETRASQKCTVKVTGVPADTSQDLLMNYFENPRRSNGGPVIGIDMKHDLEMCLITFKLPEGMFKFQLKGGTFIVKVLMLQKQ